MSDNSANDDANMSDKWRSIDEACAILGVSRRTIQRRIRDGKIGSKVVNGRRLVAVTQERQKRQIDVDMAQSAFVEELQNQVEYLRRQNEKLQQELAEVRRELAEASHRHDTVVMQLTKIVEYQQQPFWRRLFSRKALPPPVDEV